MSGLENFQNNDSWRDNFKKFLLTKRLPKQFFNEPVKETDRFSIDVVEDKTITALENIKKNENLSEDNQTTPILLKINTMNSKENLIDFLNTEDEAILKNTETKSYQSNRVLSDSLLENSKIFPMPYASNDSFEAIENMCDKTVSDPESTLYHYLHSDQKEQIIKDIKKRTMRKIEELGNGLPIEEKQINLLKELDVTQLEDIEEPSKLWENSVNNITIFQASPVKMIGLLRPSTIMEENSGDCTESLDISSRTSFETACTKPLLDISSNCSFTTANGSKVPENFLGSSVKCHFTSEDHNMKKPDKVESVTESFSNENSYLNSKDENFESEDSVIEISDEENIEKSDLDAKNTVETINFNSFSKKSIPNEILCNDSNYSDEKSLDFNDTLEEVEYLMRKGQEYMASQKKDDGQSIKVALTSPIHLKENLIILNTENDNLKKSFSQQKPKTPENTFKSRAIFDIKPIPKLELFKKPIVPLSACKHLKEQKENFSHIVSPIGAYIKKTGTTPLMSSIKIKTQDRNIFNTEALKILERESELYKQSSKYGVQHEQLTGVPKSARTLPKKGYISSEVQHYIDERTPVTIPGGQKVQKYLESVTLPAVLRHDGKIKKQSDTLSESPYKLGMDPKNSGSSVDNSLANLSLVSGDISLYTIKDAQKF